MDHDYLKYKSLEENSIIVILGAYNGDFMREYKDEILAKNIFVVNVEPDIRSYIDCAKFIYDFLPKNAVALPFVIGSYNGIVDFNNANHGMLSTVPSVSTQWKYETINQTKVVSITLKELMRICDITKIDYLFCDIEGAELSQFTEGLCYSDYKDIEYIAIASYHLVNGEQTYVKLNQYFSHEVFKSHFDIHLDIDDTRNDGTVLYLEGV